MRSRLARRGLLAFGALLITGLILLAALPLIASTQIVRDRIAYELSAWSGYRVTLGQGPVVGLADLSRPSERRPADRMARGPGPAVLEAEQVELDLSAWPRCAARCPSRASTWCGLCFV
jgi:AsmA protein